MITESYLTGIANAIRTKLGVQDTYTPPQMAAAIESIPTGGITPTGTKNITQNGTHDVTQYASANVNVQPNLQSKTATENGTVTPDQGYDGLSQVVVNVSGGGGMPLATKVGTLHDGWYFTTGGVLKFDGSDPDSVLDVFSVQAEHKYVFCYGAAAGNRGTIAFTTTNIYANPQDNLALTLIHVIDSSNRKSYYSETIFNVSQNGYIGAYIGNNIGQNISAYLIDITNLS